MRVIEKFWDTLQKVNRFCYVAECGPLSKTGWRGEAKGTVEVEVDSAGQWIHFHEQCSFKSLESGDIMELKNKYRWILDPNKTHIRLEHWRRGEAVHLLNLETHGERTLKEAESHLCVNDTYCLSIELEESGFSAVWRITGPKKDEILRYNYS